MSSFTPRSPTGPSRMTMSSSVPSRLQAAGSPTAEYRRTPTPGSTAVANNQPHNRRNSQLRSSLLDASSNRLTSAMGLGSSSIGQTPGVGGSGCTESSTVLFEWPISGWDMIRSADGGNEGEDEEIGRPDIMRRGIVFGDGVYKVDIAADSGQDPFDGSPDTPIALSIFLSCLTVETAPVEYSFITSVFTGIRPAQLDVGQRYAETSWAWHTNITHEFSRETDYARIALPDYQTVLLPQLAGDWVLALYITCPPVIGGAYDGNAQLAKPGQVLVPRDIIQGLEGLLDAPSGDVQFVCLEHARSSTTGDGDDEDKIISRKRVIYAHSVILKARSEYFKMLLEGGFRETEGSVQGKRTVLVDDASYDTVYWLLRFIYCNALTFAAEDDVRLIMDIASLDRRAIHKTLSGKPQSSIGHRLYWLTPSPQEWDYRTIPLEAGSESGDTVSATMSMSMSMTLSEPDGHSVSEASVRSGGGHGRMMSPTKESTAGRRPSLGISSGAGGGTAANAESAKAIARPGRPAAVGAVMPNVQPRRGAPPSSMASATPTKATGPRSVTTDRTGLASSTRSGKPPTSPVLGLSKHCMSPAPHRPPRLSDTAPIPDPHPHPAPPPAYPSALSMYMLAHRYDITVLEELAKERILKGLTPEKCMPMLLATHTYDALHAEVLDYVIDYFGTIQSTSEFRSAVKEVSSGQWGPTGGDVLLGLFQRL